MISTYFSAQNSLAQMNFLQSSMVQNADRNINMISFGASQPLSPAFMQNSDTFELQTKSDETKISVLKKLQEALEKKLAKDITKSTPKYKGLDYKA